MLVEVEKEIWNFSYSNLNIKCKSFELYIMAYIE